MLTRRTKTNVFPIIDLLEDRRLLAAFSWTGSGDGTSWNDTANWEPQAVPSESDSVVIEVPGDAEIVINDDITIGSMENHETVWIQGRNRSGDASLVVGNSLINHGRIRLESVNNTWDSNLVASPDASITNASDGSIELATGSGGPRLLQGRLINRGLISSDAGTNGQVQGDFKADGGTIGDLYFVGATLEMTAPQPEGITFRLVDEGNKIVGDILPNATIWVNGTNTWGDGVLTVDHDLINHGRIQLESVSNTWDSNLVASRGASITNASDGSIDLVAGSAGGPRLLQGTLINQGSISSDAGTNGQIQGDFKADGGTIGDLYFVGATLEMTAPQPDGITFRFVDERNKIIGNIFPNATIWVNGTNTWGDGVLTVDHNLTNHGRIQLESVNNTWDSNLVASRGASITNASDGSIDLVAGSAGGPRLLQGTLINQGSISSDAGTNGQIQGDFKADGGTIDDLYFIGATLEMTAPQPERITFRLVDEGNKIIGDILPNATIWVNGTNAWGDGVLTVDHNLTNHGRIRLESVSNTWDSNLVARTGGTITNASDGSIDLVAGSGGPRLLQGTLTNRGSISSDAGTSGQVQGDFKADGGTIGDLYFVGATLEMTAPQPDGITFRFVDERNKIIGNIFPNATIWVNGTNTWGDGVLTVDHDLTNHGRIQLESISNTWASNLTAIDGATITNAADGVIDLVRGTRGPSRFLGNLTNKGTIDVKTNATFGGTSAQVVNAGVLVHKTGSVSSFAGGSFSNELGGIISGRGRFDASNIVFNDQGIVDLSGATLTGAAIDATAIQLDFLDEFGMDSDSVTDLANYTLLSSGGDDDVSNGNEINLSNRLTSATFDAALQRLTLELSPPIDDGVYLLRMDGVTVLNTSEMSLNPATVPVRLELLSPHVFPVSIPASGGVYTQDFDAALGDDGTVVGIALPEGWTARSNGVATARTNAASDGRFSPGVFNSGPLPIFPGATDRALAVGVEDPVGSNRIEFAASLGQIQEAAAIKLQFDVEPWGGLEPGSAAFALSVLTADENGPQQLVHSSNVTTPALQPSAQLINGNNDENRVSFDTGVIELDSAEQLDLTIQWEASGDSAGFIYGVDNVVLRTAAQGDANVDGSVDFSDFLVLSSSFGREATWESGDFDGDGLVLFSDFLVLSENFGRS